MDNSKSAEQIVKLKLINLADYKAFPIKDNKEELSSNLSEISESVSNPDNPDIPSTPKAKSKDVCQLKCIGTTCEPRCQKICLKNICKPKCTLGTPTCKRQCFTPKCTMECPKVVD